MMHSKKCTMISDPYGGNPPQYPPPQNQMYPQIYNPANPPPPGHPNPAAPGYPSGQNPQFPYQSGFAVYPTQQFPPRQAPPSAMSYPGGPTAPPAYGYPGYPTVTPQPGYERKLYSIIIIYVKLSENVIDSYYFYFCFPHKRKL